MEVLCFWMNYEGRGLGHEYLQKSMVPETKVPAMDTMGHVFLEYEIRVSFLFMTEKSAQRSAFVVGCCRAL